MGDPSNRSSTNRCFCGLRLSHLGVVALAFGLLLWARFLLVTGHPRTAYAEPAPDATPAPAVAAHAVPSP